jgi:hypothetical protein
MEQARKLSPQSQTEEEELSQNRSKRQKVSFTRSNFAEPSKSRKMSDPILDPVSPEDISATPEIAIKPVENSVPTSPAVSEPSCAEITPLAANGDLATQDQAQSGYDAPEEGTEDRSYDFDSAYDGDSLRGDETGTLDSFLTDYRWENGRRYHAYSDGAYWVFGDISRDRIHG